VSPEISLDPSHDDFPRIEKEFQRRHDEFLHPRASEDLYRGVYRTAEGRNR
jgi:hypothetical protein